MAVVVNSAVTAELFPPKCL